MEKSIRHRFDVAEATRLIELGLPAGEVAARLGCTPRTVERFREELGVTERRSPFQARPVTAERLEAARVMLEDGASVNEVCRSLGMDRGTVERHLPGYAWSRAESVEVAVLGRRLARIDPRNALRGRKERAA